MERTTARLQPGETLGNVYETSTRDIHVLNRIETVQIS